MPDESKIPKTENYEVRDAVIEMLLGKLANHIGGAIPEDWGFSIFLYQLHDEQDSTNVFYASSLTTADALELIQIWCNRQRQ